ncbi:MAG: RidA family protein [Steroidobacteraceae bacterium]|jgi:enamine deaminase RidA (YjgF/YER057c/UK114 family)
MPPITRSLLALALLPLAAMAQEVVRHPLPNGSTFPISAAVEVPPGKTLVYLSGMVAPVLDATAAKDSVAAYGNTQAQTIGALKAIQSELEQLHLTMGDVIKMQVFMVGDPAQGGRMDFAGFMQGYTQFFGTATQPHLPVRSALQVAALANPGYLVEIEVTAVR